MSRNAERVEEACRSTLYECCKSDCVQQRLAEKLLKEMPNLTERQFIKYCRTIQKSHAVQGPFAVAWMLSKMFKHHPPRQVHQQIEALRQDGVLMRKLQKINDAWGMSCWDVVHYKAPKQIPRYHSEPNIRIM